MKYSGIYSAHRRLCCNKLQSKQLNGQSEASLSYADELDIIDSYKCTTPMDAELYRSVAQSFMFLLMNRIDFSQSAPTLRLYNLIQFTRGKYIRLVLYIVPLKSLNER